ncbi:MAG: DUF5679 domain-containing protein, partial [Nitrosopumilus sp.]|nr:DUF5679 domain-containing protein [Nitrosopumilus sp.]
KPEPTTEPEDEEATPEQLDDLRKQINELEHILSTKSNLSPDPITKQSSKIEKLEKDIKKLETTNIEQKIIQTLQKQNKKLDGIEKKIHDSLTLETNSLESNLPQAYCVKCKTKRKIKNPEETILKNGRDAIKGFCSVCDCKVFRIGKLKKY